MQEETVAVAPAAGRSAYRASRWSLRAGLGIQAGLAVTQPVLAGSFLSGNLDAITLHSSIGGLLPAIAFGALILALLHWLLGRGPGWPALAMAVLVVLVVVQATAGYSRTLGLHIPLGVTIVTSTVALFAWSLVGRERLRPIRARPVSNAQPRRAPEPTGFGR